MRQTRYFWCCVVKQYVTITEHDNISEKLNTVNMEQRSYKKKSFKMEKIQFYYTLKNIPIPSKVIHIYKLYLQFIM